MSVTHISQPPQEYIKAGRQVFIIAVNLSVSDAGEADKLAFNIEAGAGRSLVAGIANIGAA